MRNALLLRLRVISIPKTRENSPDSGIGRQQLDIPEGGLPPCLWGKAADDLIHPPFPGVRMTLISIAVSSE